MKKKVTEYVQKIATHNEFVIMTNHFQNASYSITFYMSPYVCNSNGYLGIAKHCILWHR